MQTLLHNRTFWFIATPVIILGLLVANLPGILNALGLNRAYPGRAFNLTGKRALIIATNHDTLGETGKATGVYASEMTVP